MYNEFTKEIVDFRKSQNIFESGGGNGGNTSNGGGPNDPVDPPPEEELVEFGISWIDPDPVPESGTCGKCHNLTAKVDTRQLKNGSLAQKFARREEPYCLSVDVQK